MLSTIRHMSDRHSIQPYPLRLQPELRAKLEELAAENGRSLHAEIVTRLQHSLEPGLTVKEPALPPLYVLLDSSGYPISWFEVLEHVRGLTKAAGVEAVDLKMEIVTPDMESNSRRAAETAKLAAFYRKLGKSTKISSTKE